MNECNFAMLNTKKFSFQIKSPKLRIAILKMECVVGITMKQIKESGSYIEEKMGPVTERDQLLIIHTETKQVSKIIYYIKRMIHKNK